MILAPDVPLLEGLRYPPNSGDVKWVGNRPELGPGDRLRLTGSPGGRTLYRPPFLPPLHPPPFTRGGHALSVIAASVSQPWPGRQLHLGWEEEAGDRLTR